MHHPRVARHQVAAAPTNPMIKSTSSHSRLSDRPVGAAPNFNSADEAIGSRERASPQGCFCLNGEAQDEAIVVVVLMPGDAGAHFADGVGGKVEAEADGRNMLLRVGGKNLVMGGAV